MRIRTINFWINHLTAEKENASNNTKEPQHDEDLMNYEIAEYYVSQHRSNKTKVA
jgi:hypothetical protein